jgi:Fe-S-cluster containining protein
MGRAFWKCQQCGDCCKGLLVQKEHGLEGLPLFQSEVQLFAPELVFPSAGWGIKGRTRPRPEKVILYQLDAERCPHLSDDNKCQIYQSRPLVCRSFPFRPKKYPLSPRRLPLSDECKVAIDMGLKCREYRRLRGNPYMITREHYAALVELSEVMLPIWRAPWRFDLHSKRWRRIWPMLANSDPDPEPLPSYAEFVDGGGMLPALQQLTEW